MKRPANQLIMAASALAFLASLANAGQDLITLKDLNPFTHVVRIPASADLSSIRFEQAKMVKVPTSVRSVENARYCEEASFRDPGGSLYCPYAAFEGATPAYEITYSYDGPAIGHGGGILSAARPLGPHRQVAVLAQDHHGPVGLRKQP